MEGHPLPGTSDEESAFSEQLSRAFWGLGVWLSVTLHGLGAFRRNLDEKLGFRLHATRRLTD